MNSYSHRSNTKSKEITLLAITACSHSALDTREVGVTRSAAPRSGAAEERRNQREWQPRPVAKRGAPGGKGGESERHEGTLLGWEEGGKWRNAGKREVAYHEQEGSADRTRTQAGRERSGVRVKGGRARDVGLAPRI